MRARPAIACLGAGRMARGIAVVFAYAGHRVSILDVKAREDAAYAEQSAAAIAEVRSILASFAAFGLLPPTESRRPTCVTVMPGMARILRRPPYDFTRPYAENRARNAIGCYHCHRVK